MDIHLRREIFLFSECAEISRRGAADFFSAMPLVRSPVSVHCGECVRIHMEHQTSKQRRNSKSSFYFSSGVSKTCVREAPPPLPVHPKPPSFQRDSHRLAGQIQSSSPQTVIMPFSGYNISLLHHLRSICASTCNSERPFYAFLCT